jgi:hypothetical protein
MRRFWIFVLFLIMVPATPAHAAEEGVEFTIDYRAGRYTVSMRSTVTPAHPALTIAAQVTIKVPHGVGGERFVVTDLQNHVADTRWTARSRVDAPKEDRGADYISFELSFPTQNFAAIRWQAGQAVKLFSFANSGACLNAVRLLENNDPFMPPNSIGTNPGNQIDILGLTAGNRYTGVYDRGHADCRSPDGVERTAVVIGARSVTLNGNDVQVRWTTTIESQVLGFDLFRQEGATTVQVNDALIVAEASGTAGGASYQRADRLADSTSYALYLLEVVDLEGGRNRIILGSVNGQPLFFPFVLTRSRMVSGDYDNATFHESTALCAPGTPEAAPVTIERIIS